ncbi:hypothetical protein KF728_16880 [Candidatus Obscuribacterales bacterium]|nr:hypothetical protein [Candidatus Obscuribacterales bacterium]
MPSARKLFVFDSIHRPNLKPPETAHDALPQIRSIPGADEDAGLIELLDGSLRRIIRLTGFTIPPDQRGFTAVDDMFGAILDCLSEKTSLQLLAINRPLDLGEHCENVLDLNAQGNAYLEWYADYTRKWFSRVCEQRLVPRKSFYLILGAEPSQKSSREKQIALLDRFVERVSKILSKAKQSPEVLTRAETRTLIHSCMRLSYPSGLREAPVELMRASTMPDVMVENGKQFLVVDGSRVSVQVVSSLPAKLRYGWLIDLLTMECATSLSLHCRIGDKNAVRQRAAKTPSETRRRANRMISSSDNSLIEMSFYYSIAPHVAGNDKQLKNWQTAAKDKLASRSALITPKCDQFSAWTSTLPLGIDAGGIAHVVSHTDARINWPLYGASCGLSIGLPMGFAAMSNEPVLYDHSKKPGIFAVGSEHSDLSFFNALMGVRLLTANFHVVYVEDGRNSLASLQEVLGHELVNDCQWGLPRKVALKPHAVVTIVQPQQDLSTFLEFLQDCTDVYGCVNKPTALFLPSSSEWYGGAGGARQFKKLLEEVQRLGILLCSSEVTSRLQSANRIIELLDAACDTKVILPQRTRHKRLVRQFLQHDRKSWAFEWLGMDSSRDNGVVIPCFMQTRTDYGLVRIIPSPMDFWLCMQNDDSGIEEMHKMKESLREKNPNLSLVDLARQAVYYLGVQQRDFTRS